MKKVYAQNPGPVGPELQILTNPSKNSSIMKATTQIKEAIIPASLTVTGQAGSTKITKMVLDSNVMQNVGGMVRKLTAIGMPFGLALLTISLFYKRNKELATAAAVGMVGSGVLSAMRNALPLIDMVPIAGQAVGNAGRTIGDNAGGLPAISDATEFESDFLTDGDGNVFNEDGELLYNRNDLINASKSDTQLSDTETASAGEVTVV